MFAAISVIALLVIAHLLLSHILSARRIRATPKPVHAAIEELTAHKLQHQSWMEGQRLAAEWWEKQCACPQVTDYRDIPGCARIKHGVCVQTQEEQYQHELWRFAEMAKVAPVYAEKQRLAAAAKYAPLQWV